MQSGAQDLYACCRLVMALAGAATIRDVIAFPKTTAVSSATCTSNYTALPPTNCSLALAAPRSLLLKSSLAPFQERVDNSTLQQDTGCEWSVPDGLHVLQGQCLLVGAPGPVAPAQLVELGLSIPDACQGESTQNKAGNGSEAQAA